MDAENLLMQVLPKAPRSIWARYAWTALIVGAFVVLRLALEVHLEGRPFLLFFFPVFLSSLLFDRGSGYFATVLAAVAAHVFWIKPIGGIIPDNPGDLLGLMLFLVTCFGVATLTEALRSSLERVARAEQEKAVLLRELNHRVLNDLQGVTALLRLGYRNQEDGREILLRAADRIEVLTRVYHRLETQNSAGAIPLKGYVDGLVNDLRLCLSSVRTIQISVSVEPIAVTLRCATVVGMIINELVTNAAKYAFSDGEPGTISVRVYRDSEALVLIVCDSGNGMLAGSRGSGLGSTLVRQMAGQLDGTVEYGTSDINHRGVAVTVRLHSNYLPPIEKPPV